MATKLMSKRDFQKLTDAGFFSRRESTIRAIDDLLERYPSMSNFLKSLAAFRMIKYCDEFIIAMKIADKPSKRMRGVNILRGEAEEAYGDLVRLARVQGNFRKLMHNPKFKKLGQLQTKTTPEAKTLENEALLEALDDLHRAGHGLKEIHKKWEESWSTKNFWDFIDEYLRANPQDEPYQVRYMDENERRAFEVRFAGGRLIQGYGDETHPFDTSALAVSSPRVDNVWGWGIFVYSMDKKIYSGGSYAKAVPNPDGSGQVDYWKSGGFYHHSTFLSGAAVLCAGEWYVAPGGQLVCITPRSGHYQPPVDMFMAFLMTLKRNGIMLDRTAVAWPWPDYNDRKFYNAQDFLSANQVIFKQQPMHNGVPLRQLKDMHKPLVYSNAGRPLPQPPQRQQPAVQNVQNNGVQQANGNSPYANTQGAQANPAPAQPNVGGSPYANTQGAPANPAPARPNAGRPLPVPPARPATGPYGQPIPARPVAARPAPGRLDPSRLAQFQNG